MYVTFMRLFFVILAALWLLSSCDDRHSGSDRELLDLYASLDEEIGRSDHYDGIKSERINRLRTELAAVSDERRRTEIIDRLIEEFEAYNSDSTLHYVNMNLGRADAVALPGGHTRLQIKRADILAHAGLFFDALDIERRIPRDSLGGELLEYYYYVCCATYQYLIEYAEEHEAAAGYEASRKMYADSLVAHSSPESFMYIVYAMPQLAREGHHEAAINTLRAHLEKYRPGTREYSILASILAYTYNTAGRENEYKKYLTLSAISDVQGAVKENMSFRGLATEMFEDGDIARANRYLKKSIADANFYSAMMRNVQSSKMLPVIDDAYAGQQTRLQSRLRAMMWGGILLSCVLAIAVFLIIRQYKGLRVAAAKISCANDELSSLSDRLRQANVELEGRNGELEVFNKTKEQYAGLFMEYCSSAISTLQHYQQSLRVLTARGGNRETLLKKLESTEIADQMLKNFYVRFDEAILNIYPSFVEKFNTLLRPGEQVVLKSGELLNTELRLFALIRIGIDDSAKIAEFLRCSISTVYTYRSKMRKRAVNPDEFENEVRNMG